LDHDGGLFHLIQRRFLEGWAILDIVSLATRHELVSIPLETGERAMTDKPIGEGLLTAKAVRRMDGVIHITGTVMAYTRDAKTKCTPLPLGIVGSTYRLRVDILEVPGPMKGHPVPYTADIPANEAGILPLVYFEA
jgi:hypothetical protein